MGTPARRLILQNVKTALAAISVSNGYKTNIATCEALGKSWATVKPGQKPWVGIVPQRESYQYQPGSLMRVTLSLIIIGHVSGTTQDDRASKLNDLLDDFIKALSTDTTRGSYAIHTTLSQVETDEGAPDGDGDGSMVTTFNVVYLRNLSGS